VVDSRMFQPICPGFETRFSMPCPGWQSLGHHTESWWPRSHSVQWRAGQI